MQIRRPWCAVLVYTLSAGRLGFKLSELICANLGSYSSQCEMNKHRAQRFHVTQTLDFLFLFTSQMKTC